VKSGEWITRSTSIIEENLSLLVLASVIIPGSMMIRFHKNQEVASGTKLHPGKQSGPISGAYQKG
jgi:hypothetical protein